MFSLSGFSDIFQVMHFLEHVWVAKVATSVLPVIENSSNHRILEFKKGKMEMVIYDFIMTSSMFRWNINSFLKWKYNTLSDNR